ncbi:hypothetical protein LCGC14_1445370, partial [marine sediment metagenome]
ARRAMADLEAASAQLDAADGARDRVQALTQTIQAFETGLGAMREGLRQAAINEASGLAASILNSGVLWTHNDSGDSARAFAMDTQGNHLGMYNITGAGATDWEDMAVGPGPTAGVSYLYLGDIGDNDAERDSIDIYRVPKPAVSVRFDLGDELRLRSQSTQAGMSYLSASDQAAVVQIENRGARPVEVKPLVRLDGTVIAYRLLNQPGAFATAYRLRLGPKDKVLLELDLSAIRTQVGRRYLQVYLMGLPTWGPFEHALMVSIED